MSRTRLLSALVLACVGSTARSVAAASTPGDCTQERCVELVTIVRRAGDRVPVSDVRVLVVPERERKPGDVPAASHIREKDGTPAWIRTATSDTDGRVVVPDVPDGRVRVVVIGDGFERHEHVLELDGEKRVPPLFIREVDRNPYRTIVARPARELVDPPKTTTRVLAREEIRTIPGTQGDPLRAVQNLPGVARAPAGAGLLVLRGAPPGQSRVFLGDHPVPRAFHVLGFSSIIPADAIDTLEVMPSNYSSRYGGALGGVVVMQPRTPRRDGFHGFAKIDLTSAGAMVETPIKKASFFAAAQRGYVDAVLRVAERIDETVVFALPNYFDYQTQVDVPLSTGTEVVARVIGSGDRWTSRTIDYQGVREEVLELTDQFHRGEIVWRGRRGPWRFLLTPAFRFETRRTSTDRANERFRGYATTWRFEIERRLNRRAAVTVGVDGEAMPFSHRIADAAAGATTENGYDVTLGLYTWATIILGPLTLWPGARMSVFARELDGEGGRQSSSRAFVVDPRLLARFEPAERWAIDAGIGAYSQVRSLSSSGSSGVLDGNTPLGGGIVVLPASARAALDPGIGVGDLSSSTPVDQALHVTLGTRWSSKRGLEAGVTGFLRHYTDDRAIFVLAEGSISAGYVHPYTIDATNYGAEFLVRQRIGNRLYAWAAYTLMRSQARTPETPVTPGGVTPGSFDQRHNLVLVASYALPRNFRIGGRFRLVSGAPFTPIVGSVSVDMGVEPLLGGTNSARFPVFHQLDLRLDKSWVLRRSVVLAYVDVQNVYNHENVEAYVYSFDYRERVNQVGLPIFPTIGLRVEW